MNMPTPPSLLDDLDEHQDGQPPDPPAQEVDFSEYVWMGEELEEFDRQVWCHVILVSAILVFKATLHCR